MNSKDMRDIRARMYELRRSGHTIEEVQEIIKKEFGREYKLGTVKSYSKKSIYELQNKFKNDQKYMDNFNENLYSNEGCTHDNTLFIPDKGVVCQDCGKIL